MKDQRSAADAVAGAINPAEISADAAALDTARTLVTLLEARQKLGLSMRVGLPAVGSVAKATMLAVNLREELVRAHRLLDRVGRGIGVQMEDFGKDVPPQAHANGAPVGVEEHA